MMKWIGAAALAVTLMSAVPGGTGVAAAASWEAAPGMGAARAGDFSARRTYRHRRYSYRPYYPYYLGHPYYYSPGPFFPYLPIPAWHDPTLW